MGKNGYDLSNILPIIYQATITDESLIREVDLGPFKHKVDDGLPLRKASFQCLDTLLDNTPYKMDLFEYIKYLRNGINDEGSLDSSLQTPIRDAILKQLDNPSNDVQSIACAMMDYNNNNINIDTIDIHQQYINPQGSYFGPMLNVYGLI